MARLYANENFPLQVVLALRAKGHEVITVQESGLQAATDESVLAYAVENELAVLTMNRRHFLRLHNLSSDHAGMLLCTYDPDFNRQADRIHMALQSVSTLSGQLLRVNRPAV